MRRSGAVLFEVLLSLGLFVGAAAFTLGATRNVLDGMERTRLRSVATDLARAKLAELEAGMITISDLRDDSRGINAVGSIDPFSGDGAAFGEGEEWEIEVETERTEYTGLVLVELTVRAAPDPLAIDDEPIGVTLRQLMPLTDEEADAYELDEMMEDLPEPRGARDSRDARDASPQGGP